MNSSQFEELHTRLSKAQFRKRIGLISFGELRGFVRLVERTKRAIETTKAPISLRSAVLIPRTSLRDYEWDHPDWQWGEQYYVGPHTVVEYAKGEYSFERVDGSLGVVDVHPTGARVTLVALGLVSILSLLKIIKTGSGLSNATFEPINKGEFCFVIPLDCGE